MKLRTRHMPCKVRPNKKIYDRKSKQDLDTIAEVNRILFNYEKILRLENKADSSKQPNNRTTKTINHTAE